MIKGKEEGVLQQAQELFCLIELVVSSNPRSELTLGFAPAPTGSKWLVVQLALTYYENFVGLFKTPISNLQLTSFKSLEVCPYTRWNTKIQVFSSVPCTRDVGPKKIVRKHSFWLDPCLTVWIGKVDRL